MKSILFNSAILSVSRYVGLVAVIALAAVPAVGAGAQNSQYGRIVIRRSRYTPNYE
jgi:hypothetical protein